LVETNRIEIFPEREIAVDGENVAALGFARRLTPDRLIAGQTISPNAALITRNRRDFRSIARLRLVEWAMD
jgi:predicted nucleic acid-binding protein